MASNQRKERRLKDRLRAGDEAIAELSCYTRAAASMTEKFESVDLFFAYVKQKIDTYDTLEASRDQLRREFDEVVGELHQAVRGTVRVRDELSESRQVIAELSSANKELVRENKEVVKLRRRLRERKIELDERNTACSKLRQSMSPFSSK
ncbi:hypothetical protein LCGC14_2888160 [marine sediment metagenome]|uniref:Uncharacterized protein n=1 Tax=marine sediment metagenome TaxID=412755 RepID=A0A0F8XY27_9ZZZZ